MREEGKRRLRRITALLFAVTMVITTVFTGKVFAAYDMDKPVIESVTFTTSTGGTELTNEDSITVTVQAYDADSGISEVKCYFSYKDDDRTDGSYFSDGLSMTYDAASKKYTGTLELKDIAYTQTIQLERIYVDDAAGNNASWSIYDNTLENYSVSVTVKDNQTELAQTNITDPKLIKYENDEEVVIENGTSIYQGTTVHFRFSVKDSSIGNDVTFRAVFVGTRDKSIAECNLKETEGKYYEGYFSQALLYDYSTDESQKYELKHIYAMKDGKATEVTSIPEVSFVVEKDTSKTQPEDDDYKRLQVTSAKVLKDGVEIKSEDAPAFKYGDTLTFEVTLEDNVVYKSSDKEELTLQLNAKGNISGDKGYHNVELIHQGNNVYKGSLTLSDAMYPTVWYASYIEGYLENDASYADGWVHSSGELDMPAFLVKDDQGNASVADLTVDASVYQIQEEEGFITYAWTPLESATVSYGDTLNPAMFGLPETVSSPVEGISFKEWRVYQDVGSWDKDAEEYVYEWKDLGKLSDYVVTRDTYNLTIVPAFTDTIYIGSGFVDIDDGNDYYNTYFSRVFAKSDLSLTGQTEEKAIAAYFTDQYKDQTDPERKFTGFEVEENVMPGLVKCYNLEAVYEYARVRGDYRYLEESAYTSEPYMTGERVPVYVPTNDINDFTYDKLMAAMKEKAPTSTYSGATFDHWELMSELTEEQFEEYKESFLNGYEDVTFAAKYQGVNAVSLLLQPIENSGAAAQSRVVLLDDTKEITYGDLDVASYYTQTYPADITGAIKGWTLAELDEASTVENMQSVTYHATFGVNDAIVVYEISSNDWAADTYTTYEGLTVTNIYPSSGGYTYVAELKAKGDTITLPSELSRQYHNITWQYDNDKAKITNQNKTYTLKAGANVFYGKYGSIGATIPVDGDDGEDEPENTEETPAVVTPVAGATDAVAEITAQATETAASQTVTASTDTAAATNRDTNTTNRNTTTTTASEQEPTERPVVRMEAAAIEDAVSSIADAIEAIAEDPSGETPQVHVDMQGATVVPLEILQAAKGQNVDVVLDMGGYSWTINGEDILASNLKEINLEVQFNTNAISSSLIERLAGDRPTMQLSLTHNGDFGFKATLTVNAGAENAGQYGNLYYHDSNGKLVFQNAGQIQEDGSVSLAFSHASDYVLVIGEDMTPAEEADDADAEDVTDGVELAATPQQSSKGWLVAIVVMVAAILGIAGFTVARRKR